MSETRDILAAAIAERQPAFGDAVVIQRNGVNLPVQLFAEIEPIADIETNMLLGRDARASNIFHILRASTTEQILENDIFLALGQRYLVLVRSGEDNFANPQMKFETAALTDLD